MIAVYIWRPITVANDAFNLQVVAVSTDYQGQGHGLQAVKAARDEMSARAAAYGQTVYNVQAQVHCENSPSKAMLGRAGFLDTGVVRNDDHPEYTTWAADYIV